MANPSWIFTRGGVEADGFCTGSKKGKKGPRGGLSSQDVVSCVRDTPSLGDKLVQSFGLLAESRAALLGHRSCL